MLPNQRMNADATLALRAKTVAPVMLVRWAYKGNMIKKGVGPMKKIIRTIFILLLGNSFVLSGTRSAVPPSFKLSVSQRINQTLDLEIPATPKLSDDTIRRLLVKAYKENLGVDIEDPQRLIFHSSPAQNPSMLRMSSSYSYLSMPAISFTQTQVITQASTSLAKNDVDIDSPAFKPFLEAFAVKKCELSQSKLEKFVSQKSDRGYDLTIVCAADPSDQLIPGEKELAAGLAITEKRDSYGVFKSDPSLLAKDIGWLGSEQVITILRKGPSFGTNDRWYRVRVDKLQNPPWVDTDPVKGPVEGWSLGSGILPFKKSKQNLPLIANLLSYQQRNNLFGVDQKKLRETYPKVKCESKTGGNNFLCSECSEAIQLSPEDTRQIVYRFFNYSNLPTTCTLEEIQVNGAAGLEDMLKTKYGSGKELEVFDYPEMNVADCSQGALLDFWNLDREYSFAKTENTFNDFNDTLYLFSKKRTARLVRIAELFGELRDNPTMKPDEMLKLGGPVPLNLCPDE